MRRALLAPWVLLALVSCASEPEPDTPEGPIEWSVSAATTQPEVEVGDDFTVTLTLTHPPESDFIEPPEADFEPFDVLETWKEDVSPIETKLHYRLAAYQLPDELEVAPLVVRYRDDAGEMASVETEAVTVRLVTSLTADVTDIHDIKDPMALEVPRDWTLLWWLLLAALVSAIAYLIYRKLRKDVVDDVAPVWVPPPRPPHEEAELALTRLAEKGLIERGEIALFYTELTDIMKRYAGRRFEVAYLERTTGEILSDLAAKDVPAARLGAILEVADLVKFAKQMPDRDQAQSSLEQAGALVRDTRPAPVREPRELEATA